MTKIGRALIAVAQWTPLVAIRSGFISLLPLLILQGVAIALASTAMTLLAQGAAQPGFVQALYELHGFLVTIMPTLAVVAIAYHAAGLYRTHRAYAAVLTLLVYNLMLHAIGAGAVPVTGKVSLAHNLWSLLLGPMVPWLFSRIDRVTVLHLFSSVQYTPAIRGMLNSLLPSLLVLAIFITAGSGIDHWALPGLQTAMPSPDPQWTEGLPGLLACEFGINALWSIGVHGSIAMTTCVQDLHTTGHANLVAAQQGLVPPHLGTDVFFDAWVHMGGSGMTMGLIIAVLLVSRSRNKRLICYSSLPISLFNVNEVVLYGLPVIFNRFLILPFMLAPLLATCTTWFALTHGWVPVPTQSLGWTTPPLIGAFVATRGDWAAVALAAMNLALAVAVYVPFVRRWEHSQQVIGQQIVEYQDQLGAGVVDAGPNLDHDQPQRLYASVLENGELAEVLDRLRNGRLEIHYQPIIDLASGKAVAVEALLRLHDPERGLVPPTFLPVLQTAGLMHEIDRWVIDHLVKEWGQWDPVAHPMPAIHVNVSPESLLRVGYVEKLLEAGQFLPLIIEIVEDQLPADIRAFTTAVDTLRRHGLQIALDDFGVGHSSLSRLAQLGISQIKIDRSLLVAVGDGGLGTELFIGVVALARRLRLRVCVEGVERNDQLAFLVEQDVDDIQGFIASRPLPWARMREVMQHDRPLLGPGFRRVTRDD